MVKKKHNAKDSAPSQTGRAGGESVESAAITAMFNNIAPTYDRLNHMLSLGIDRRWRH